MKQSFIIFLLLFIGSSIAAQRPDSLGSLEIFSDTSQMKVVMNDTTSFMLLDSAAINEMRKVNDYPNPKKAAILGLIIPGAGHIYNKRFWYLKVPVVYGGIVGAVYFIQFNNSNYNLVKDVYCRRLITEGTRSEGLGCPPLSNASKKRVEDFEGLLASTRYNSGSLKNLRDSYDKNRQLSWVGLIAGHLILNGVWSFVDAHLNDFDLDDDLSMKLQPSVETLSNTNSSVIGVGIVLEFH